MPLSSAVVAGNPALASQYNDLREDAIALTVSMTSGEAFSQRDALYVSTTDFKVYKALNDSSRVAAGWYAPMIAAETSSGADQTVKCYVPGGLITGYSGLTVGLDYYTGPTAGTLTTIRSLYHAKYGYALNSTTFVFTGGASNAFMLEQSVLAGENWAIGNLLYQKKSDGLFYRADADSAESGICEVPAIACFTHTDGSGTSQAAFFPGSMIFSTLPGTSGNRIYPSATTGAFQVNTPASYDTYYRVFGYFIRTSIFNFTPQEMQFLPTGIQEKGQCAGGGYGSGGSAGGQSTTPVNFKKIMSNTPSSITFTRNDTYGGAVSGPSAESISRFGFNLYVRNNAGSTTWGWGGTYQTVGN